ncbi:MAG: S8 family serine peptidase [Cyclobacteriaceae bacterium]|nr:S8 family serine peptidase [Cyclobacteriaceae bacterium]
MNFFLDGSLIGRKARIVTFIICNFFVFVNYGQQNPVTTLHVKFKEQFKPTKSINGRTSISGLDRVDAVSKKFSAIAISRIFPDAGIYEAAHRAYELHLWYEITFPAGTQLQMAIAEYTGTSYFEKVEAMRPYVKISGEPLKVLQPDLPEGTNDPLFNNQWNLKNTGQTDGTPGADINLVNAWKSETGSSNVIVAVIDGGIDLNHPDLRNSLWVNPGEIPGNGIDDDLNGYVDDVNGYGFGDNSSIIYPDNHGTHVAGIIGATSNNGIGIAGVAGGNGTIAGVKLMSCASFGQFSNGRFEAAMVYAADNGAVISQNSWGGSSTAIEAAINYFIERAGLDNTAANFTRKIQTGPIAGGVVVFAAGNSATSDPLWGYPASYFRVIAVGATDHSDKKANYSNYGTWIDIFAPGSNILSTVSLNTYAAFSGTSMACPHVSGVAALVISKFQQQGFKADDVWNRLRFASKSIESINPGYDGMLGWGRIDALLAVRDRDFVPPGNITNLSGPFVSSSSITLSWTASGEDGNVGRAAEYDIRYSTTPITNSNFQEANTIANSPLPPSSGGQVTFEVTNLTPNTTYFLALKSKDVFGNISGLSNVISVKTLRPPIPEAVTTGLNEELYTGALVQKSILIKNAGEEELKVRLGIPQTQPASLLPPLGAKGRLFAINSIKNTIEEINPHTGQILNSIPLPEPSAKAPEGLAFDGTYLYYARSRILYKLNATTGVVIRTLELTQTDKVIGLAWSGKYLYLSKQYNGYSQTIELDTDTGLTLRTFSNASELAYFKPTNSLLVLNYGNLQNINLVNGEWTNSMSLSGNPQTIAYSAVENMIYISDGFESIIKRYNSTTYQEVQSIAYPPTTAIAGDEHPLSWIETDETVFTIPSGQTRAIPLRLNTSGINAGTLTGSVKIYGINSSTQPISIPVLMNVLSGPDLETAREVNFGNTYTGTAIDTTILVANRGFSNLTINEIKSNDTRVTLSHTSATLAPGQQINLKVSINSTAQASINTHIVFTSNDPDEGNYLLPLKANILLAPAIFINPTSLHVTLAANETAFRTITISNPGHSTLNWRSNLSTPESPSFNGSLINPKDSIMRFAEATQTASQIVLKANSPEPLKNIVYDSDDQIIYAQSLSNKLFRYLPTTNIWHQVNTQALPDFSGTGAYLGGKLYYGGSRLFIYDPLSNQWTFANLPEAGEISCLTQDGISIYAGINRAFYRFNPLSQTWTTLPPVPTPAYVNAFATLNYHSGILYATGVSNITGDGNTTFFKYEIESETWIESERISGATTGSAIDPSDGRFFIGGGGIHFSGNRNAISVLDIKQATWRRFVTPFEVDNLVYVNQQEFSGIFFSEGVSGTKFGYYKTAAVESQLKITPTTGELTPGTNQDVTIRINSQSLFGGTYRSKIKIYSTKPVLEANVDLKLEVVGQARLTIKKFNDFGITPIGYEYAALVKFQNSGTAKLIVDSITSSNPNFKINKRKFEILVGESLNASVLFAPTEVGFQSATFKVHTHSVQTGDSEFIITGTGTHKPFIETNTDTLRVNVLAGKKTKAQFVLRNTGLGPTTYIGIYSSQTWIATDVEMPQNIEPGNEGNLELSITAEYLSGGIYVGSVFVEDYFDPSHRVIQLPVKLMVQSAPCISVNPAFLNFGEKLINAPADATFSLKNNGDLPLLVSAAYSDNIQFTINSETPISLEPGELKNVNVKFINSIVGIHIGQLSFESNDPEQSLLSMPVQAESLYPPKLELSDEQLSFTLYRNDLTVRQVNIRNVGAGMLQWILNSRSYPNDPEDTGNLILKNQDFESIASLSCDPLTGILYARNYSNYYPLNRYNPQTNSWQYETNFPHILQYEEIGSTIQSSKIYYTFFNSTDIQVYDLIFKEWETISSQLGTGTTAITTDGTLLYLAGNGKFMSLNPTTNEWALLPIPNFVLDGRGGMAYLDGKIFAHSASSFGVYTITSGVWEVLISLPSAQTKGATIDPILKRYYTSTGRFLYEYDITTQTWHTNLLVGFPDETNKVICYSSMPGYEGIYIAQVTGGKEFLKFKPEPKTKWLSTSFVEGYSDADSNQLIEVSANARNLEPGRYEGMLQVNSNDPEKPQATVAVHLTVIDSKPSIVVPPSISSQTRRPNITTLLLPVTNEGREPLIWSFENQLPAWLSSSRQSGVVLQHRVDSIHFIFHDDLFETDTFARFYLRLRSNDPAQIISEVSIGISVINNPPFIRNHIPDQTLTSGSVQLNLQDYFYDIDGDDLIFSAAPSNTYIVKATILNDLLLISPINQGIVRLTITAKDRFLATENTSFEVNNLVTAVNEIKAYPFSTFPNPFQEGLVIRNEEFIPNALLVLKDNLGRTVKETPVQTNETYLDTSSLPAGFYLCLLYSNNELLHTARVIKK